MFAIIENQGKQYKVSKDAKIKIDKTNLKSGEKITFDKVLLISDGKSPKIGTPIVENASVSAEVIENKNDPKIIVFKKKRRHNYRRKLGHKQEYTIVKINEIKG